MKLKFIIAIGAIAAMPLCAQAQGAKVTNADAQKVVKIISADKAKVKIYCDMAKLGAQLDEADKKKDNKKVDELSDKMDDMGKQLGPEYVAVTNGLQDMKPDSKEAQAIGETLGDLDDLCGK